MSEITEQCFQVITKSCALDHEQQCKIGILTISFTKTVDASQQNICGHDLYQDQPEMFG